MDDYQSMLPIVNLRGRELEPGVVAMLTLAQIHTTVDEAARKAPLIARDYAVRPALDLWGYSVDGVVLGLVGVERTGARTGLVHELAVLPEARRRGVGRALLAFLRQSCGFAELTGLTLPEAQAFYVACGFEVSEDGALPDGRVRLRFVWGNPNSPASRSDCLGL